MSSRSRDILTVILVILLTMASFVAGFLVKDFVTLQNGRSVAAGETEEFSVFWEAWDLIKQNYIGDLPTSTEMTYGAISGALGILGDPYTRFIEPVVREQERNSLRGNFGGIGANIQRNDAGEVVLSPIPGNPAEAAGILDGDVLVAVDGLEVTDEMTVEEIAGIIRGEEGTAVTLSIIHPGGSAQTDITIVRAIILLPSVAYSIVPDQPTIGYIRLSRFSGESGGEVKDAILSLQEQGAEQLILDLRQNGGGLLDAAVSVGDHFLDEGVVLYQISRSEDERVFMSTNETVAGDMPLVVLVDGGTASASEIVAGALQDRGRATLIGTTTFGKGSVQLVYDLSDGSSVHVTSARWYTPDRHQIDQQGLEPDISVVPTEEAIANGQDEILDAAVTYLLSE
ncbi:MAG: S41 family peptidase [Candidatus Promineifilaceae bacterium]